MNKIWDDFQKFLAVVRRYVSPVFIMLLVASFTLWYIAKLNYNYTTELNVKVRIGNQKFEVPCVVEGKGTNLFGYVISTSRLNIPLEELEYTVICEVTQLGDDTNNQQKLHLQSESLKNAISIRLSDINIRSVISIPDIEVPKGLKR